MVIFSTITIPITAFASVSSGVLFYSGKIALATVLGFWLVRLVKPNPEVCSRTQLLLGLIVTAALFAIPYVGGIIYAAACLVGAGAIVMGIRNCRPAFPDDNSSLPPASPGQ